ncbi:ATP-dependent helicase [bacterium]|nr:ATP-dependent helicase [bacterium]
MLIQGSVASRKTEFLINKYAELVNSGVNPDEILVLVQNSTLKQRFADEVLKKLEIESFSKLKIYSFFSLVYNAVADNWAILEGVNPDKPQSFLLPNLTGLEVSQYILKDIIKKVGFKGYNSGRSLLHQLFRRYSLIVQNNLSKDEIKERGKILKEPYEDDINTTMRIFLRKTLSLRSFDYLRQSLVFNYIYKNTDYFKEIKYLLLDDGDEITPLCFDFIEFLTPQLKDWYICYDFNGSSRAGYLSADKSAVWEFERLFKEKSAEFEDKSIMLSDSKTIFLNVKEDKRGVLNNFEFSSLSKRSEIINTVVDKIISLTESGVLPSEILVITPNVDEMLKFTLEEKLKDRLNVRLLSGSKKLTENLLVLSVLNILKLNTPLKNTLSELDLRPILNDFLGIPVKYCDKILEKFNENKTLIPFEFQNSEYINNYSRFLEFLDSLKEGNFKLSQQAFKLYEKFAPVSRLQKDVLSGFGFFLKELRDFESVFGEKIEEHKADILLQIENSIISENPYSTLEIEPTDLIVGTPQKIIDNQIKTQYQFWLDVSNQNWMKSDIGPLYNSWVFQKNWDKDDFTTEDNIILSKDKTARVLRKLTLLAGEKIYTYSSLFDGSGAENFGGIEEFIVSSEQDENKKSEKTFKIIPRDDQKPVLEYKSGKMAVSAVPGAGKTTILLALIINLMEDKIPPENIFVMTYMESAARNFREKIKNIFPNSSKLPNISTIHGLALRILKENNNFERMGLDGDFGICDDTLRGRIIKNIAVEMRLDKDEMNDFDRAVSIHKFSQVDNPVTADKKLLKFLNFFGKYESALKERNLIDYDDILLYAVKILEKFEDVREYYQNICHYVIEDEAQDSSSLQQKLINILCAKYGNLIRCGDINQSITTTFSNADVEGFRRFNAENPKVSMDCSQRCTHDVWTLANTLVSWAESKPELKNSFYPIFMKPVQGRNPDTEDAVKSEIFLNSQDEKAYIVKEIRKIFQNEPDATVGILLRSNFQVNNWISHLAGFGFSAITRTESLGQKLIFKVIFSILKAIVNPFDNFVIANVYETLSELGEFKIKNTAYIKECEKPFIQMNSDDIEDIEFARFYWEIVYWISQTSLTAEQFAIKIGLKYFNNFEIEKANAYLISTLIKRFSVNGAGDIKTIVQRLDELSKRSRVSGLNFFSKEDEDDDKFFEGKVQIMTMHKSKGDEFDYVFLPELLNRQLKFSPDDIKVKSSDRFNENLRRLSPDYKPKTDNEIIKQILTENLKLMYVAITRAKKYLYLTTYEKNKPNEKPNLPNLIFTEILSKEAVL